MSGGARRTIPTAVLLADLRRVAHLHGGAFGGKVSRRLGRFDESVVRHRFGSVLAGVRRAGVGTPAPAPRLDRRKLLPEAASGPAMVRACLRCEAPFLSAGPGNRLCRACTGGAEWASGVIETYGRARAPINGHW
jgi:hypothetical protein